MLCRQVQLIRDLQIELNEMGAVINVLPHLARPSDRIAKEVLGFICIMLFNANAKVQVGHLKYTKSHIFVYLPFPSDK